MKPSSSSIPSSPAAISSSPPKRDHVPPLVRNSACAAVGPRQFVASLLWQSVRSSELCSLIELRADPLAGSARKIAPLLWASRSSSAECWRAFDAEAPPAAQLVLVGAQPADPFSSAAIFSAAVRSRGSNRAGSLHHWTSPNSR